jgi:GTP-binding protein Era
MITNNFNEENKNLEVALYKHGSVALIGKPNVGKSTILNSILGERLSITSRRPQTTRHRILGIHTGESYQIEFHDTPGFSTHAKDLLSQKMRSKIREVLGLVDLILLVVPPYSPSLVEKKLIQDIQKSQSRSILVINKIDLIPKTSLLPLISSYEELHKFLEIIPISAKKNYAVSALISTILNYLPYGSPTYGEEEITDRSERFIASELIREQLFHLFAQEIPYDTAVEIETFKENGGKNQKDLIEAVIYVNKSTQKQILIGSNGDKLKIVGTRSRLRIEEALNRKIFLSLWVQVKEQWKNNQSFLEQIGY